MSRSQYNTREFLSAEDLAVFLDLSVCAVRRRLYAAQSTIQKKWIRKGKGSFWVYKRRDVLQALSDAHMEQTLRGRLKNYISVDVAYKLYNLTPASLLYRLRRVPVKVDTVYICQIHARGGNVRKYYHKKQLDEAMLFFEWRHEKKTTIQQ